MTEAEEWVPEDWRMHAACIGAPQEIFFPSRGKSIQPARAICNGCVVSVQCLEDAIIRREPAGVRGGLSAFQRRKVIKKLNLEMEDLDDEDYDD